MDEDSFQEILRVQQMMSQRLMQEQKVDRKIDVIGILNDLTDGGRKRAQMEAVLIQAQLDGLAERETLQILDELERDHMIRRPQQGWVERVS